jgi:hypothetical protein
MSRELDATRHSMIVIPGPERPREEPKACAAQPGIHGLVAISWFVYCHTVDPGSARVPLAVRDDGNDLARSDDFSICVTSVQIL